MRALGDGDGDGGGGGSWVVWVRRPYQSSRATRTHWFRGRLTAHDSDEVEVHFEDTAAPATPRDGRRRFRRDDDDGGEQSSDEDTPRDDGWYRYSDPAVRFECPIETNARGAMPPTPDGARARGSAPPVS